VKVNLIWTSFTILPLVAGSFLIFMGNFISNDYFIYETRDIEENEGSLEPYEENKEPLLPYD
jgi:hypothetical protein